VVEITVVDGWLADVSFISPNQIDAARIALQARFLNVDTYFSLSFNFSRRLFCWDASEDNNPMKYRVFSPSRRMGKGR